MWVIVQRIFQPTWLHITLAIIFKIPVPRKTLWDDETTVEIFASIDVSDFRIPVPTSFDAVATSTDQRLHSFVRQVFPNLRIAQGHDDPQNNQR